MQDHKIIDQRSLEFSKAIAQKIDADESGDLLKSVRSRCKRWLKKLNAPAIKEWDLILQQDWLNIKKVLLEESGNGQRLRQSSPFAGVLSNQERLSILKKYK